MPLFNKRQTRSCHSRLDGLADVVEEILNFAGIRSDLAKEAVRLWGVIVVKGRGAIQAVARIESMRHGCGRRRRTRYFAVGSFSRADLLTMLLRAKGLWCFGGP